MIKDQTTRMGIESYYGVFVLFVPSPRSHIMFLA